MPRSKTGAEPGLHGAFFTFQKKKKNSPRPEQNSTIIIYLTGTADHSAQTVIQDWGKIKM